MGRGGGGATMPGNQLPPAARSHKVTLVRPHSGAGFGFSIRGGVEHSCGIYVSEVEVGGEAHLAGLQPGDQITRISGVPLAAATHREAVQLIVARARLVLTVLSGGLIPVKVRRCEPLTWSPVSSASPDYSSAPGDKAGDYAAKSGTVRSGASDQEVAETKLSITLAGHQGLGCSICKVTAEHNFPLFSVSPQSSVLIE